MFLDSFVTNCPVNLKLSANANHRPSKVINYACIILVLLSIEKGTYQPQYIFGTFLTQPPPPMSIKLRPC